MQKMRAVAGAMFLLCLLLSSCTSGPLQTISPSPAVISTPSIPQQLRIFNRGAFTLSHLQVRFPNETVDFGDLAPGAISAYHTFTHGVYRYAAYNVTVEGKSYQQPVVDWVGEQPMDGSVFTYLVDVNPAWWTTEGLVIRLVQVNAEPPGGATLPMPVR